MSKQYPGGFITKNFTAPTATAAPGMWTLDQAMYYIKQSLWPLPPQTDPYFQYVTALLHGDGNAAGTVLFSQDAGPSNLPMTLNNDIAANTKTPFTPPAGTSTYGSGYFPGSNGYISTPSSTSFGFGTGDFTMEAWLWLGAQVNTYPNWIQMGTGNTNAQLPLGAGWGDAGVGYVLMVKVGTDRLISGYNQSSFVGVWSHLAVVRSSGVVKTYVNGNLVDTWANTTDVGSTNFLRSGCGINEYGNFPWNGYISNLRVTNTAVYTSNFTPSTTPLTAISGTKILLMQNNFTGNNNVFYDSSSNNFAITRYGNTTQGTFTPYGSNWSNYFDGTGDYLSVSTTAGDFGSSAFTIEAWVYFNSVSGTQVIGSTYQSSSVGWNFGKSNSTGCFYVGLSGDGNDINGTTTVAVGTWYHIAVSGTPGATGIKLFVNGVQEGSTYTGSVSLSATVPVYVGDLSALGYVVNGYISNFRLVKGTAVYTSNFTPPTTPLTAISGTSLLTCQSNRFIDNSTNAYTVTKNGDVSVQRFSPFSPTSAYSASVIGGSAYFDGSGDYLTAPDSSAIAFGSGDLTIECWCYSFVTTGGADQIIVGKYTGSFGSSSFGIGQNNTTLTATFYTGGSSYFTMTSSVALQGRAWNHIAVTRSGNSWRLFLNGVQVASTTQSVTVISNTTALYVGGEPFYNQMFTGYISNLRIVKGTAVYTSAFTPPSAPLTAITNTSVLLSSTNAGIYDNAMMNNWETVGDATVSPTIYKYGTGSLKFDGTGDRLTSAANPGFAFGTGDFTIEGWFYINSGSGGNNGALQFSANAGGLQASTSNTIAISSANPGGGNVWGIYYANTVAYGSATSTQTWIYLALVRSSGSLKLYINGTADATFGTKTDTTNYTGQNLCVGGYYSTSYLWNGYIDDLRVTKGVARYTTNFTAPTSAFPNQ